MAFKKKFIYLNEQDKSDIEQCCAVLRRTADSRRNMFYIVANYGEYLQGSVFESSAGDARNYIEYLEQRHVNGKLKEHTCACMFLELRTFFECASANGRMELNPFAGIESPFQLPDKLRAFSLPSLSDVDRLLVNCPTESDTYMAILLAFRMGLTVSEIAGLKKEQICLDEAAGRYRIKMWRWDKEEKKELFLTVPGDISARLREQVRSTPTDYEYVFRSRKKVPYRERTLQKNLEQVQEDAENKIRFSHLRSLCVYLMLQQSIPVEDVCRYVGTQPDWFVRYDNIPEELICDAADYVKLNITK